MKPNPIIFRAYLSRIKIVMLQEKPSCFSTSNCLHYFVFNPVRAAWTFNCVSGLHCFVASLCLQKERLQVASATKYHPRTCIFILISKLCRCSEAWLQGTRKRSGPRRRPITASVCTGPLLAPIFAFEQKHRHKYTTSIFCLSICRPLTL